MVHGLLDRSRKTCMHVRMYVSSTSSRILGIKEESDTSAGDREPIPASRSFIRTQGLASKAIVDYNTRLITFPTTRIKNVFALQNLACQIRIHAIQPKCSIANSFESYKLYICFCCLVQNLILFLNPGAWFPLM